MNDIGKKFTRLGKLKWRFAGMYGSEASTRIDKRALKKKYKNIKFETTHLYPGAYFDEVKLYFIFKTEADEAEFMLRESL